jgi:hypothetical protein
MIAATATTATTVLVFTAAPAASDVCEGMTVTPAAGESFIVELTLPGPGVIRVDRDGEVTTHTPEDATTTSADGLPVWVLGTEGATEVFVMLPDNGSGAPDPSCGIRVLTTDPVPPVDPDPVVPPVDPDPVVPPVNELDAGPDHSPPPLNDRTGPRPCPPCPPCDRP